MLDTVTRYLGGVTNELTNRAVSGVVNPIADRYSSQPLTTAGLVIKAGGSALAKTGAAAWYGVAKGVLVTIAASTDMPALTGLTITAANFNVALFFIDSASVVTLAQGTQATTIGGIKWPQFPLNKALVGLLNHYAQRQRSPAALRRWIRPPPSTSVRSGHSTRPCDLSGGADA
jgi:hypothetical protein